MNLRRIQDDLHLIILNARRFERLINSPEFITLVNSLQGDDLNIALLLISKYDYDTVVDWFKKKAIKDIGELSIRDLRDRARRLHIPRYSLMGKGDLIRHIVYEETRTTGTIETIGNNESDIRTQDQDDRADSGEIGRGVIGTILCRFQSTTVPRT